MLTGSRFGDVMAGKTTKRYLKYQREIVLELLGAPAFQDDAPWFKHGIDNEAEGLGAYAFQKGLSVTEAGFITHHTMPFVGCSPDGLIGDDIEPEAGGVELKCRSSLKAHHKTIKAGIDSVYTPQVQGCLMVTGRDWWDFASYYVPENRFDDSTTDLHIHRVWPDVSYITKLEIRLQEFWDEVNQQVEERSNA